MRDLGPGGRAGPASPASAPNIVVTGNVDEAQPDPNDGDCSLREAAQATNINADLDIL